MERRIKKLKAKRNSHSVKKQLLNILQTTLHQFQIHAK